ncbi:TRAP transporter small permease [uncultured Marivita sp.]|uniref:TRAP transporter small permease n=1 Tax=uncultured Marivita sp. TaxID=888080 RepID=UPI002630F7EF|nr:TRAP transporter small permease [uncultured Marivita sp.]
MKTESDTAEQLEDAPVIDLTAEDTVALGLFVALLVIVFLQFFTRYVLNSSFGWTEEIARYLLVCTVFAGCLRAQRRGGHMALDLLGRWRDRAWARVLQGAIQVVSVSFFAALAVLAWQMGERLHNQRMAVVDVPVSVLYYLITAFLAALVLRSVVGWIVYLRTQEGGK